MADTKMYVFRLRGENGPSYSIPAKGVTKKDGEYVFLLDDDADFGIERLLVDEVAMLMELPVSAFENSAPAVTAESEAQ